jgi:hypothetical protein
MAEGGCLEGCSVFVTVTHSGGLNASTAFGAKVGGMGVGLGHFSPRSFCSKNIS